MRESTSGYCVASIVSEGSLKATSSIMWQTPFLGDFTWIFLKRVKLGKGVCSILWLATSPILVGSQCCKEDSNKGGISICKPYIHVHNHQAFVWNLQHCQYVWTRGVQCLVSCLFMKFAELPKLGVILLWNQWIADMFFANKKKQSGKLT